MGDPLDFLLDDRAGIEIRGDVVAGGSDEFHAALMSLFVGVCADEGGEEGVMDVDDFPGEFLAKGIGQDLHEAGEDDEFHVLREEQIANFKKAVLAAFTVHCHVMEGNPGALGDGAAGLAVADDGGDFDGEFVEFGAPDDLVEAVVGLGDEDGGAHFVGQRAEVPYGLQGAAEGAEAVGEILHVHIEVGGVNFQAGEKFPADTVGKLAELDQVATVGGDVGRDFRDNARLVG